MYHPQVKARIEDQDDDLVQELQEVERDVELGDTSSSASLDTSLWTLVLIGHPTGTS